MATTKQQEVPLYLRVWLTQKCHVELTISGELNAEAFKRLADFLSLTAEIWEKDGYNSSNELTPLQST